MYRNGRQRRGIGGSKDSFKGMLILTGSVLGIAIITFIITYSIYNSRINQSQEEIMNSPMLASLNNNTVKTESASSEVGKSINEVKQEMNSINVVNITEESSTSNVVTTNTTSNIITMTTEDIEETETATIPNETVEEVKEEPKKDVTFVKPVEGEIIREFAKENLVYSQTLDEWITHLGLDIKADKTTVVKAAADGTVETIKNDPRYGLTVVIAHDSGFKTVYSNLLTAEFVTEGEKVEAGQTLGTVGNNAAFEVADEPHLHFELIKDNEKVDPKIYIKF